MAFGIFWFLIALMPVSNLVPTSTKMADRYLFLPTIGVILAVIALAAAWCSHHRARQSAVSAGLCLVVVVFTGWSYDRTEVWSGKTTLSHDRPAPDLSLWTAAVAANPQDTLALTNLGFTYLRLEPPEAVKALECLQLALRLSEANQRKVAGGKTLILTPVYEGLGQAYFERASRLPDANPAESGWREKKEEYANSVKYFQLTFAAPSGFAQNDIRILRQFSDASEGLAQMETAEMVSSTAAARDAIRRDRDALRNGSDKALERARELSIAANISSAEAEYRLLVMQQGTAIFNRETGASTSERVDYYRQALTHYQEAAALFPDDPRPFLYQGLCYERLSAIEPSLEDKQKHFAHGEAALRKATSLHFTPPDYSPALPYRALASLYSHVEDYPAALDALKRARQAEPSTEALAQIDRDIENLQQFNRMRKH